MHERAHERTSSPLPRPAVAEAVYAVLAHTLGVDPSGIRADAALEDLGLNSLKTIEMNVALEEKLGFTSPEVARPDELGIVTVDDLVSYVVRVLAGDLR